jgi:hypothetical protein
LKKLPNSPSKPPISCRILYNSVSNNFNDLQPMRKSQRDMGATSTEDSRSVRRFDRITVARMGRSATETSARA